MRIYCLDTNAILDLCYRFYPKHIFSILWENINSAITARQIKFIITQHIQTEITAKISQMRYDMAVFQEFMTYFNVSVVEYNRYEASLAQIKADLMQVTSIRPANSLNNLDNDLSSVCISILQNSTVITSEQGFNKDITTATNIRNLKIPDICHYFQVDYGNLLMVLDYIGFTA